MDGERKRKLKEGAKGCVSLNSYLNKSGEVTVNIMVGQQLHQSQTSKNIPIKSTNNFYSLSYRIFLRILLNTNVSI